MKYQALLRISAFLTMVTALSSPCAACGMGNLYFVALMIFGIMSAVSTVISALLCYAVLNANHREVPGWFIGPLLFIAVVAGTYAPVLLESVLQDGLVWASVIVPASFTIASMVYFSYEQSAGADQRLPDGTAGSGSPK